MNNLNMKPWELARFTIPQVLCLTNATPETDTKRITTFEEYQKVEEQQRLAEEAWSKR